MRWLLSFLDITVPEPLKKRVLRPLFISTAQAFDTEAPEITGLSSGSLLEAYAQFTRKAAEDVLADHPDPDVVRVRLFQSAFGLGSELRERFRICSPEDVLKMSRIIYKVLGISLEGRSNGEVTIRSCYFSRFYSGDVCRLVSALDEGAAAGLSGGGRLEFSQRMTEGHDCCRGRLFFKDASS